MKNHINYTFKIESSSYTLKLNATADNFVLYCGAFPLVVINKRFSIGLNETKIRFEPFKPILDFEDSNDRLAIKKAIEYLKANYVA